MTPEAEHIKFLIHEAIEKQGCSIEDMEEALEKHAGEPGILGPTGNTLYALLKAYGASALGAGALGGMGLYGGLKAIDNSDKRIDDREERLQKIHNATKELNTIYAQQHGMI
jgi:hypothetical protein